ncbi:MAG: redoxin domain-containing protein [Candidatus Tectomicrobia bacterium]
MTADDNQIQFSAAPGTGLCNADEEEIAKQIRVGLRGKFEPMSVPLQEGFDFIGFKALGSGSSQAVAMPIPLSNGFGAPASAINDLNNLFLNLSDDFAIGVSKEFILSLIQPSLDALKATHPQFIVSGGLLGSATYTTNFQQVTASWANQKVHLHIQGNSTSPTWWAPNVSAFIITQDLELQLDATSQTIAIVPLGQPWVSVSVNGPFGGLISSIITPIVKSNFISQRDAALAAAQSQIQDALTGGGNINDALHDFDESANAEYKVLDSTPDGMILRGTVSTKSTKGGGKVMVHFTETGDGTAFTALQTWIPGGTVEEYTWSWKEGSTKFLPWIGSVHVAPPDKHSFILPKPATEPHISRVCLKVVGTEVGPSGTVQPIEGGETCSVSAPSWLVATMPAWWDLLLPFWGVDPAPEDILENAILAHVDALPQTAQGAAKGANTLVHFGVNPSPRPLEALGRAFGKYRRKQTPLAVVLVLPQGSFAKRRSVVEERLGAVGEPFSDWLTITEDYEGAWSRAFAVERRPATYLINALGEFVWHHVGPLDAKSFHRTLDKHLVTGPQPRPRLLRLRVRPGDPARDFLFQHDRGEWMALRKLRGQRVLLNFWKSWSKPCLTELGRLQSMHDKAGREGLIILAINSGEDPKCLAEIRRKHKFKFTLVPDREWRITRTYGVNCWPTTVSISEEGLVEDIQFGVKHDHLPRSAKGSRVGSGSPKPTKGDGRRRSRSR